MKQSSSTPTAILPSPYIPPPAVNTCPVQPPSTIISTSGGGTNTGRPLALPLDPSARTALIVQQQQQQQQARTSTVDATPPAISTSDFLRHRLATTAMTPPSSSAATTKMPSLPFDAGRWFSLASGGSAMNPGRPTPSDTTQRISLGVVQQSTAAVTSQAGSRYYHHLPASSSSTPGLPGVVQRQMSACSDVGSGGGGHSRPSSVTSRGFPRMGHSCLTAGGGSSRAAVTGGGARSTWMLPPPYYSVAGTGRGQGQQETGSRQAGPSSTYRFYV